MKEYLANEIKKVRYDIGNLRDELSNAHYYQTKAIEDSDLVRVEAYTKAVKRIEADLMEHKARLNDLKREWRYLDVSDDYTIHKESLDELSGFPRSVEAILIMF